MQYSLYLKNGSGAPSNRDKRKTKKEAEKYMVKKEYLFDLENLVALYCLTDQMSSFFVRKRKKKKVRSENAKQTTQLKKTRLQTGVYRATRFLVLFSGKKEHWRKIKAIQNKTLVLLNILASRVPVRRAGRQPTR